MLKTCGAGLQSRGSRPDWNIPAVLPFFVSTLIPAQILPPVGIRAVPWPSTVGSARLPLIVTTVLVWMRSFHEMRDISPIHDLLHPYRFKGAHMKHTSLHSTKLLSAKLKCYR